MPSRERKAKYIATLKQYMDDFKNILVIGVDNVGSAQLQETRMALRKTGSKMLMGKNTIIRSVFRSNMEAHPEYEAFLPVVQGNIGFVFTNEEDLKSLRDMLTLTQIPAAAKSGQTAPQTVTIPMGSTGLDPGQTSFFQALDIQTKITKGSIEILNNVTLCREGEKISASAVALLGKLAMKPFFFGIKVNTVFENGSIYSSAVLDMTEQDLVNKFASGIRAVAAISMAANYPTLASLPHSIANAFKKLVAVALETDYMFEEAKIYKEMVENPDAFASAAPAEEKKEEATAAPVEEEEEEEEEEMEFDLFD